MLFHAIICITALMFTFEPFALTLNIDRSIQGLKVVSDFDNIVEPQQIRNSDETKDKIVSNFKSNSDNSKSKWIRCANHKATETENNAEIDTNRVNPDMTNAPINFQTLSSLLKNLENFPMKEELPKIPKPAKINENNLKFEGDENGIMKQLNAIGKMFVENVFGNHQEFLPKTTESQGFKRQDDFGNFDEDEITTSMDEYLENLLNTEEPATEEKLCENFPTPTDSSATSNEFQAPSAQYLEMHFFKSLPENLTQKPKSKPENGGLKIDLYPSKNCVQKPAVPISQKFGYVGIVATNPQLIAIPAIQLNFEPSGSRGLRASHNYAPFSVFRYKRQTNKLKMKPENFDSLPVLLVSGLPCNKKENSTHSDVEKKRFLEGEENEDSVLKDANLLLETYDALIRDNSGRSVMKPAILVSPTTRKIAENSKKLIKKDAGFGELVTSKVAENLFDRNIEEIEELMKKDSSSNNFGSLTSKFEEKNLVKKDVNSLSVTESIAPKIHQNLEETLKLFKKNTGNFEENNLDKLVKKSIETENFVNSEKLNKNTDDLSRIESAVNKFIEGDLNKMSTGGLRFSSNTPIPDNFDYKKKIEELNQMIQENVNSFKAKSKTLEFVTSKIDDSKSYKNEEKIVKKNVNNFGSSLTSNNLDSKSVDIDNENEINTKSVEAVNNLEPMELWTYKTITANPLEFKAQGDPNAAYIANLLQNLTPLQNMDKDLKTGDTLSNPDKLADLKWELATEEKPTELNQQFRTVMDERKVTNVATPLPKMESSSIDKVDVVTENISGGNNNTQVLMNNAQGNIGKTCIETTTAAVCGDDEVNVLDALSSIAESETATEINVITLNQASVETLGTVGENGTVVTSGLITPSGGTLVTQITSVTTSNATEKTVKSRNSILSQLKNLEKDLRLVNEVQSILNDVKKEETPAHRRKRETREERKCKHSKATSESSTEIKMMAEARQLGKIMSWQISEDGENAKLNCSKNKRFLMKKKKKKKRKKKKKKKKGFWRKIFGNPKNSRHFLGKVTQNFL